MNPRLGLVFRFDCTNYSLLVLSYVFNLNLTCEVPS